MKVLGIAGYSGSGKTTVTEALLPRLIARGLSVSTIKHAHHNFDVDKPGKDSYRHRAAGAKEVMVSSGNRWALMHELRGEAEYELTDLIAHMAPVDLILVEGFKRNDQKKIEVWRPGATGTAPLFADDPHVIAVTSDEPIDLAAHGREDLTFIPIDDLAALTDFIVGFVRKKESADVAE